MKTFEERLATESAVWAADGIVTTEQRAQLLARHPAGPGGSGRFMGILAAIGGALFVVGVSLVIKSNWERIGDWVKIGGLLALLVASYTGGWRLKVAPGCSPRIGDALLMIGAVCFLLGIALVSQIFHIDDRPANGVLLWWAGIAAVPWLTQAKGAQWVSVAGGLTWLGMETSAADSWLRLVDYGARWNHSELLTAGGAFLTGVALFLSGLALRGGRHGDFAGLHEKLGLIIAGGALYVLGFTWSVHNGSKHAMVAARWQPIAVLAALVTAAGLWAWARNRADFSRMVGWLALGLVPALAHLLGAELNDSAWLWGAFSCVALFLLNLGMIRTGLATGREGWINLGMAGIALNVVTRYFLLFGTMLEGGVFFIVTGMVVLGLGFWLERKRRALVGSVRREVAS